MRCFQLAGGSAFRFLRITFPSLFVTSLKLQVVKSSYDGLTKHPAVSRSSLLTGKGIDRFTTLPNNSNRQSPPCATTMEGFLDMDSPPDVGQDRNHSRQEICSVPD